MSSSWETGHLIILLIFLCQVGTLIIRNQGFWNIFALFSNELIYGGRKSLLSVSPVSALFCLLQEECLNQEETRTKVAQFFYPNLLLNGSLGLRSFEKTKESRIWLFLAKVWVSSLHTLKQEPRLSFTKGRLSIIWHIWPKSHKFQS